MPVVEHVLIDRDIFRLMLKKLLRRRRPRRAIGVGYGSDRAGSSTRALGQEWVVPDRAERLVEALLLGPSSYEPR